MFDHVAAKIAREPDEIVRMLRAPPSTNLFLQNQREISAGLVKIFELDRLVAERFCALHFEQSNLDLTLPGLVVEEWISV